MLLVSVLLLGAGGALIMTTMMSANNSVGSTAEMQAYYVAESGMQSALNVLRGNTKPLLVRHDRMSFRTAIIPSISNGGNGGTLRFAGWLPYNDPSDASEPRAGDVSERSLAVIESQSRTWIPTVTSLSFRLLQHRQAATQARLIKGRSARVGGTDEVTIRYSGQRATTLSPDPYTFPLTLDSALGSFVIERPASSTADNVAIPKTGFEITITQSLPWAATTILEGTFEGEVDSCGAQQSK